MPFLSIVVPTFNERENIVCLTRALAAVLGPTDYEIVFVDDDSPDGTAAFVRSLAQRDARIRVIERIGRRGLSGACVEGILSTSSPFVAVMDADLQHDERILPRMIEKLATEGFDIVVGTRNGDGGSMGDFSSDRVALSNMARAIARYICPVPLSDPMSGYFVMTRAFFAKVAPRLGCIGFKILVDLVASSSGPVRVGEVGYTFRSRSAGQTKLDLLVSLEFVELVLSKLLRGWIPVSYLLFATVGSVGVLANVGITAGLYAAAHVSFQNAHLAAAVATVALNFFLNNVTTFRSSRLHGADLVKGLLVFYAGCSIGLFAQFGITSSLGLVGVHWAWATFAGAVVGSVWNYATAYILVWQVDRRRRDRRLRPAYDDVQLDQIWVKDRV